jgi:hypothetical protein
MRSFIDMVRGMYDHRFDLWLVVILGLVVAWMERGGLKRRLQGEHFDAWWFFRLPRAHTRQLGRIRKR